MFLLALVNGAWAHLRYEDNVTLTFTTTARNSEVVIGVAMAAFPGHPLVYMAILVGPLVELPVLLCQGQLKFPKNGSLNSSQTTTQFPQKR
jgi:ACR3 family arsenite efflux pump ArsB